jgi:hypothetical protein
VLATLLLVLAPASASASTQWDWAINGSPVAAGKKVAITAAATVPLTIAVPALELTVKCEGWTGKGDLLGGMTGTGRLKSPGETCEFRKDHKEPGICHLKLTDGELSVGESAAGPPGSFAMFVKEIRLKGRFSGAKKQETLKGEGTVPAEGPLGGQNLFEFGAGGGANFTVAGSPATLTGQLRFTVKSDPASAIAYAQL